MWSLKSVGRRNVCVFIYSSHLVYEWTTDRLQRTSPHPPQPTNQPLAVFQSKCVHSAHFPLPWTESSCCCGMSENMERDSAGGLSRVYLLRCPRAVLAYFAPLSCFAETWKCDLNYSCRRQLLFFHLTKTLRFMCVPPQGLCKQEMTIALYLTKRQEGNVLNSIDSHYSERGRQEKGTDIPRQVVVKPPDDLFFFSCRLLFEQHQQKAGCRHPMLLCFWGSGEPINVCSQRGESIQKANCSLRPWAMKKWERQRETAERERGKGVDNMFPLLLYTERNNMITAAPWHKTKLTGVHWEARIMLVR